MKYDAQLAGVQNSLPNAKNILVALSKEPTVDELAAGLALFLSLKQAGKTVSIVTEGVIRVEHTNLFGVGDIKDQLPQMSSGDFVLVLSGVATPGADGKGVVTSVEKMDYFTQGNDLNLIFRVVPGKKFEPAQITSRYEGGSFDLIFTVGASNLNLLGSIYTARQQMWTGTQIINIDNKQSNSNFGSTNIIDGVASSVSEIVAQVIVSLKLPFETDIATNILSGIFTATSNLQGPRVTADTYDVVSNALRVGGQKPAAPMVSPQPVQTEQPIQNSAPSFDLSKVFNQPLSQPMGEAAVSQEATAPASPSPAQPSPEETPSGERVESETPESDWLTPKIYKGSSLG
ncbi:MAG: hypothetical protein M1142_03155 [Patescibacteria group bacterium]|nr:hypothetical protein [Patescibacteria group bacterium]